jgi:hypothetical protein
MGARQFRKALPFELPFSDTSAYLQNHGLPKDDETPIVLEEGWTRILSNDRFQVDTALLIPVRDTH